MPKMLFFYIFFMILLFLILHMLMNIQPHPILMILLILINTFSICLMLSLWQPNPMYSILLFLIMISGLLIIFLYFSSLITNVQNKLSVNFIMLFNFIINLIFLYYLMYTNFKNNAWPLHSYMETQIFFTFNQEMFKNLFMIYTYPYNNFTFLCMFFLLIAMFIIIKLCTIKSASLRKIS